MRYLSDTAMAKKIDELSIKEIGIPSVVLMERAAMAVAACVCKNTPSQNKILVLCGNGNNGADGIATARMLKEMGYHVDVMLMCGEKGSKEFDIQLNIANKIGVSFVNEALCAYETIIDAIFGIGLSRSIEGRIAEIINAVNATLCKVFAIDVPSGISADGIRISDVIMRADYTVTFGTNKLGLVIGKNAEYAGEIIVADIGFPKAVMDYVCGDYFYYEDSEVKGIIPRRRPDTNKGSYGKVLAVCGSYNMAGAALLCAKAAYKSGAGMVKVISHSSNRNIIQTALPEGLFDSYDDNMDISLSKGIEFADTIIIGPGLGTDEMSLSVLEYVVKNSKCNIIVDADGINILAMLLKNDNEKGKSLMAQLDGRCIITPHVVEMARLTDKEKKEVKSNLSDIAIEVAKEYNIVVVQKDSRSIVSDGERMYVNISGNNGMATAGSGDVLSGIIGAFVAQGKSLFEGACAGCFVHGLSGDDYALRHNRYSLTASDLIDSLENIL